jgi:hypothetical protein
MGERRRFLAVTPKTFTFEFDDNSPKSISYEVGETERLRTTVENGVPFVFANREGMVALAKLLIKLSMGNYGDGFHIHLRGDFSDDAGQPDVLTLMLNEPLDERSAQTHA